MVRPSRSYNTFKNFLHGLNDKDTYVASLRRHLCYKEKEVWLLWYGYHVTEQVAPVAGGQLHPALRRQTVQGDLLVAVEHGLAPLLHTAAGVRAS